MIILSKSVKNQTMPKQKIKQSKEKELNIPFDFPLLISKKYVAKDASGNEKHYLEGFAATDDFDMHGDIISKEAMKKAASHLEENSTVLFNHHDDQPVGRVIESRFIEKQGAIWVKILISSTVPDIWQKIKEGVLNKFSIRGDVVRVVKKFVADLGVVANVIEEMILAEVSLVSVPANPGAKAVRWYVAKALREFEKKGGVIPMSKRKFETVEKTDEIEISKSQDPSPALEAASEDDNIETDDAKTNEESDVVQDGSETVESKDSATDETSEEEEEVEEAPEKEEDEVVEEEEEEAEEAEEEEKEEEETTEKKEVKKTASKSNLKKGGTAPQPKANEGVKPKTGVSSNDNPKPGKGVSSNDNPSPKKGVKKNLETVAAMLQDIRGYLESPDVDASIPDPSVLLKHINSALKSIASPVEGTSKSDKQTSKALIKLQKQVGEQAKTIKKIVIKAPAAKR